jgi:hypothetical protein
MVLEKPQTDTTTELYEESDIFETDTETEAPGESDTSQGKSFRCHAKKFYLTYSRVPDHMTPNNILDHLKKQIDSLEYVIGEEYHADGERRHFHVIVMSPKRVDVRCHDKFAIYVGDSKIICHCKPVYNLTQAAALVAYTCKEGTFLSNMKIFYEGAFYSYNELLLKRHEDHGI